MSAAAMAEIKAFLPCETPDAWVKNALDNQSLLLIDHAHCEKKAASTALSLMYRYVEHTALLNQMSRLAREELRHFEQVLALMVKRGVRYGHLSPSRYAASLRAAVREEEPGRLIDVLIVGAIIEARSCERFAKLAPHLDAELREFYQSLLASEARHFLLYLDLARSLASEDADLDARIHLFLGIEQALVQNPDTVFRFHSGPVQDVVIALG